MSYNESHALVHFGISGMKWYVRRFQNEDGTLTEEGKRRYSKRSDQIEGAKYHLKKQMAYYKKQLAEQQRDADRFAKQSRDQQIIDLWGGVKDAYDIEEDDDRIDRVIKYEIEDMRHRAQLNAELEKEARVIFDKVSKMKINVLDSDKKFKRDVDDLISQHAKGVLRYYKVAYLNRDTEEYLRKKSQKK